LLTAIVLLQPCTAAAEAPRDVPGKTPRIWTANSTRFLHESTVASDRPEHYRSSRGRDGRETIQGRFGSLELTRKRWQAGETVHIQEAWRSRARTNTWREPGALDDVAYLTPIRELVQQSTTYPRLVSVSQADAKRSRGTIYYVEGYPESGTDTITRWKMPNGMIFSRYTRRDERGRVVFSFTEGSKRPLVQPLKPLEEVKADWLAGASALSNARGVTLVAELAKGAANQGWELEPFALRVLTNKDQMAEFCRLMSRGSPIARYRLEEQARILLATPGVDPALGDALRHTLTKLPQSGPTWPKARTKAALLRQMKREKIGSLGMIMSLTHPEEIRLFASQMVDRDPEAGLANLKVLGQLDSAFGQEFRRTGTQRCWQAAYEELAAKAAEKTPDPVN
jgi:hypothetical protein